MLLLFTVVCLYSSFFFGFVIYIYSFLLDIKLIKINYASSAPFFHSPLFCMEIILSRVAPLISISNIFDRVWGGENLWLFRTHRMLANSTIRVFFFSFFYFRILFFVIFYFPTNSSTSSSLILRLSLYHSFYNSFFWVCLYIL